MTTIAIFGDIHGQQDKMVQSVRRWEHQHDIKIDLILSVGDFQTLRNEWDMRCMPCPEKYVEMGEYAAYYRGEKDFPVEVIFIGGNHEAYNLLDEHPQGTEIGRNCYYIGRQSVCTRFGLRIAGLTGIFSPRVYHEGRWWIDWFGKGVLNNRKMVKQATYFVREEVEALAREEDIDILLLHGWPADLAKMADSKDYGGKPRFAGDGPTKMLVEALKPRWLFCGHMHWYYRGHINWPDGRRTIFVCLDQIAGPRDRNMAVLQIDEMNEGRLIIPDGH